MLEKLFKSKTTVGILSVLLMNEDIHLRELARRIKITPIYVSKELVNLRSLGLVGENKVGNMSLWSINKKSPIYNEIRQLFMKTDLLGSRIKPVIGPLSPKFAFIYGSFAAGTEKRESDIDLFIVGDIDEDKFLEELNVLEREIGRELNYLLWSNNEFMKKLPRNHLLEDIREKPIIWVFGDYDEFRRLTKRKAD